jgi:cellulose synthase/poly-beta-1,6-N-acetylglucosamine synthase-like glycosyltransferase
MEAFDQPWKREFEGDVGAYWGVYDAARHAKFPFAGPIYPLPHWPALAAAAATLAFISFLLLGRDGRALRHRGLLFLGVVALGLGSAVVWLIDSYAHQYWTATSIAVGALLTLGLTMVATVLLVETHEWAEALWVRQRRRPLPVFDDPAAELPKVSIHVPTHNEPPDMVIATLDALARIDHADYEVLVIDNNTREPSLWQPVERHCAVLGARFRFFHVGNMAGYKAGALNFALRHTAPDAGVIAIVDSDYQVRPDWLRSLLPSFADPRVAIVQAPQDYHDGSQNPFKAMCCEEYRGFFHIGMITRNDRNAIIQHGTMTLIRRHVLEEVGGWGEWCITEDAELGLRVFEKGYHALYTPRSYGQGLTPDTFLDYKKQRYRWAYGAMQILRAHAGALLRGGSSSLTRGQRFHFIAGWLPWLADGVNLFFTLAAVAWAAAMLVAPLRVDPPLPLFVMPPLMLFAFKLGKLVHLYRRGVGASWRQTASAALAGLALSHTIAKAVVAGCLTRNQPFICTPKMKTASPLLRALASAQEEAALLLLLWSLVFGLSRLPGAEGGDMRLWMAMLVVQSLPYLAAVTTAMISALPGVQRATRTEPATRPAPAEGR